MVYERLVPSDGSCYACPAHNGDTISCNELLLRGSPPGVDLEDGPENAACPLRHGPIQIIAFKPVREGYPKKNCSVPSHHPSCTCEGEGGDR